MMKMKTCEVSCQFSARGMTGVHAQTPPSCQFSAHGMYIKAGIKGTDSTLSSCPHGIGQASDWRVIIGYEKNENEPPTKITHYTS